MTSLEDNLMNFILLRTAKSFYFLKRIGYNYKRTNESITKKLFLISQRQIKFIFIFLKLIFEYSKNTKYEKDLLNLCLTSWLINFDKKLEKIHFNKDFYFYYEVINMIINCLYITDENLNLLINLKKLIEKKINFHN